jgi:serine/threonine-protein kinase
MAAIVIGGAALAMSAFFGFRAVDPDVRTVRRARSVAVLPFEVGGTSSETHLADGIADEVVSQLATIPGITVVTIRRIHSPLRDPRQVGFEAGVAAVLHGTVRTEANVGGAVRVAVRLTGVDTGAALWEPKPMVRELVDISTVPRTIAIETAGALNAYGGAGVLPFPAPRWPDSTGARQRDNQGVASPSVRDDLLRSSSDNATAYALYLRAVNHFRGSELPLYYLFDPSPDGSIRTGVALLDRIVHLHPRFTAAHAALAYGHARLWWSRRLRQESTDQKTYARRALDRALALDPTSPDVRKALGFYYYWCELDYDRALQELSIARKGRPGDSEIVFGYASVLRRQGKVEPALALFSEAVTMEPFNPVYRQNVALTYALLRDSAETDRALRRLTSLNPEFAMAYALRARWLLRLAGDVGRALEVVSAADDLPLGERGVDYAAAVADLYARDYQRALDRLSRTREDGNSNEFRYMPKTLFEAQANALLGRSAAALAAYGRAAAQIEARLQISAADSRLHSALGLAYAGLGRRAEAIKEGRLAVDLLPVEVEQAHGASRVEDLARIYAMVGESDAAIDRLEYLMSIPYDLAAAGLRVDPSWDALRNLPRFRRLVGQ